MQSRRGQSPNFWGEVLNPWVVFGAIGVAVTLLLATVTIFYATRPKATPFPAVTAVLNVVIAPTSTATPIAPTATPVPTPVVDAPPAPPPGVIALEARVQVVNTEGDGLRLRVDPGLAGEVRFLGAEGEVFIIKDGPKDLDGFTWWYVVADTDSARRGWGVANYLAPLP
jgi:hypothetical protein